MAKRNIKAVPQIESTIQIEYTTAPLIKCVARVAFTLGNVSIKVGETFFLVKSVRREGRYYVVHFSNERCAWQCSCGANCTKHAHTKASQQYVVEHIVKPRISAIPATTQTVETRETDGLDPNLASTWKTRNKRAKAEHAEYVKGFNVRLQASKELQEAS